MTVCGASLSIARTVPRPRRTEHTGSVVSRRNSKQIKVGDVLIGGGAPISVQSMTTTKTEDVEATVAEIQRLEEAGCEIVRITAPNVAAAEEYSTNRSTPMPSVAR